MPRANLDQLLLVEVVAIVEGVRRGGAVWIGQREIEPGIEAERVDQDARRLADVEAVHLALAGRCDRRVNLHAEHEGLRGRRDHIGADYQALGRGAVVNIALGQQCVRAARELRRVYPVLRLGPRHQPPCAVEQA